jgi:hypothetical protein
LTLRRWRGEARDAFVHRADDAIDKNCADG